LNQELEDGLCLVEIASSQAGENMLRVEGMMRTGSGRFICSDAIRLAHVRSDDLFSRPTKAFGIARAAHLKNDCFLILGRKLS
jgi:hypothetical protein